MSLSLSDIVLVCSSHCYRLYLHTLTASLENKEWYEHDEWQSILQCKYTSRKTLTVSFYFWNKNQMSLLIIKRQNFKNKNMKFNFADLQCVDISNLIADLELVRGPSVRQTSVSDVSPTLMLAACLASILLSTLLYWPADEPSAHSLLFSTVFIDDDDSLCSFLSWMQPTSIAFKIRSLWTFVTFFMITEWYCCASTSPMFNSDFLFLCWN